jgi:putative permease
MQKQQTIKLVLFFLFLITAIVFAIMFPRLTLPFGFTYIIYLMAKPFTLRLTTGTLRQRTIYSILMAICFSFLLLPLIATLYDVDTNFSFFYQQLPELQKILQEKFSVFKVLIFNKFGYNITVDPVKYFITQMESAGSLFIGKIPKYLSSVFEWVLLVPLFLYFFFRESSKFSNWSMQGIPNSIFEKTYVLFSQFNRKFGEYIVAKFIEATILGSLVTMGLFIIGFPYPFILGLIAGVSNILPYLGPVIGIVPALLIALLSKDSQVSMFGMFIVFSIANLIDMVLVFPLLVSKIVNLHPIIVVVSIIVGSQLGGIVGMIVIIPFVAFFKLLFKEIYKDLSVNL